VTPQLASSEGVPDSSPTATATDIVLVEDNALEVELTLRPIRELDPRIQIEISRDGEEALDFLLARGAFRHRLSVPLPRLVMLGLKLPKLDGIEVLRGVRGNSRSCVQKPVRHQEFGNAIQDVARYWLNLNQPPPSAQPVN
jgi:two-component system, response regulator